MTGNQEAKPGILVVDDNPCSQAILYKGLIREGFDVITADSGEAALARLSSGLVDLILLNVIMPGIDGFETCDRIKHNVATADIPIIFMTAYPDPKRQVQGLTIGAVDYLSKPLQIEEVIVRIKIHLNLHITHKSLLRQLKQQEQTIKLLEKTNHALSRLANLDGLTQIANRYCFDESLTEEWLRLARAKQPLGLILCDVDYFKRYNDEYGHQAGDDCLRKVARFLYQSARRPTDLVARYGGEEFVVLLPNTDRHGIQNVAEIIRAGIESLSIPHKQSQIHSVVTVSLGCCSLTPNHTIAPSSIVQMADKALYYAKHKGRNQAAIA